MYICMYTNGIHVWIYIGISSQHAVAAV